MSASWAIVGALLVVAGCSARADEVARPLRAGLIFGGLAGLLLALIVSVVAATLHG